MRVGREAGAEEGRKEESEVRRETLGLSPHLSEPLSLSSAKTEVSEVKGTETLCHL